MTISITVALVAIAASIAATAHSRPVLEVEEQVSPRGTLAVGEARSVQGRSVRLDSVDVATHVASADTRGWDKRITEPDHRFLRLTLSIENTSDSPVDTQELCKSLRPIETTTGEVPDTGLVWMRGYDALEKRERAPGEEAIGTIALYVYQFVLVPPAVVLMGEGGPAWRIDPVDRDARVQCML